MLALEETDLLVPEECAHHHGYATTLAEQVEVRGVVVHGAKLGRAIGFPTANMKLGGCCRLAPGIYAVRFRDGFGTVRNGVASFGRRPTVVDDGELLLETYVLDYAGDLYGQTCQVTFIKYLRPETKFDGLEAMVQQIDLDVVMAREVLRKRKISLGDEITARGRKK
ncbi:riboflavin kinase [Agrobacterium salinitolerans]|uniref:riboflavin kinase n=1 Tax=Agrobacterium salinitolerans TaxID=1183413 RepID=UPI002FCE3AD0